MIGRIRRGLLGCRVRRGRTEASVRRCGMRVIGSAKRARCRTAAAGLLIFDPVVASSRALGAGRYITIGRSDLAPGRSSRRCTGVVETIFDDTVELLVDDDDRVLVRFASGAVSASSTSSWARTGCTRACASSRSVPSVEYEALPRHHGRRRSIWNGHAPRDELVAVMHTEVGAQVLRLALRDGATMFCCMFRHHGDVPGVDDRLAQQALLRERLQGLGWEVPKILEQLPQSRTFYMDKASQIRLPAWSRGRVGLIGDAAACPSLLAGQGSALAMAEAYVLACALNASAGATTEPRLPRTTPGSRRWCGPSRTLRSASASRSRHATSRSSCCATSCSA